MSDYQSTLQLVAKHLALAMRPLREAVADLHSFQEFMVRLGWNVQSLPVPYSDLALPVNQILETLEALEDQPQVSEVETLLTEIKALYEAIQHLQEDGVQAPTGVVESVFRKEIGERLFNLLLIDYLESEFPGVANLLKALGIIAFEFQDATDTRPPFLIRYLKFNEIPRIINDPASIPELVYGWGTATLNFPLIAEHLYNCFLSLGFPASIAQVDPTLSAGFQSGSETIERFIELQLKMAIAELEIGSVPVSVALALLEFPAEDSHLPGVILQPLVPSGIEAAYALTDSLSLLVQGETDLASAFGIVFRPGELFVRYPFEPEQPPPSASVGLALVYQPKTATVLLGSAQASRLQCAGATTGFNLAHYDDRLELSVELLVHDLALVIALSEQDNFIAKLFSGTDLSLPIPLALRWSNLKGLSLSGSSNFTVVSHPHLALGPITIDAVQLSLRSTLEPGLPPELVVEAVVSFSGSLEVLSFSVEGIGVQLKCAFLPGGDADQPTPTSGNAGPFNIEVGFKRPAGIGLKIDAAAVVGGGYILFDAEKALYAGMAYLEINNTIAVTAIGILATRLPDGSDGFSLLLIITAEGFPPLQLGYGFTLLGIGGLLGIHRTAAVQEMQAGLKNRILDTLLFPDHPVENASQYISDLQRVFPPTEGRHLFGPMVIIGWGSPTVLTLELALILDLPSPLRLIAAARLKAVLPTEEARLVVLQIDAIGVVDFDAGEASLDGTLHDSMIVGFPLTGDMALRASWGAAPSFLLAIGGFHPQFQPPPGFPALERLAINLATGSSLRLRLDAYLALTSNTLQFGAHLDMYAKVEEFTVQGGFWFDSLLQFSPFRFTAEVGGAVSLMYNGESIMTVQLDVILSGPAPWQVNGKASFEFLGINESVDLNWQTGQAAKIAPLPAVDLKALLSNALSDVRNWSGQIPEDGHALVSLSMSETVTQALIHPLGNLTFRQQVVPLKIEIERYGNNSIAGENYFEIVGLHGTTASSSSLNLTSATASAATDYFSPAYYFELSDAEKLSRPSFEALEAGVSFQISGVAFAETDDVAARMDYETVIIDPNIEPAPRPFALYSIKQSSLKVMTSHNAAAQSAMRTTGRAKYSTTVASYCSVSDAAYVVASVDDMTIQTLDDSYPVTGVSYTEAEDALNNFLASHPEEQDELQIVGIHEVSQA